MTDMTDARRYSDSLLNMQEAASGPLLGGFVMEACALSAQGRTSVPQGLGDVVLLIAPCRDLLNENWRVEILYDPSGTKHPLVSPTFAPYTEREAFVPFFRPQDVTAMNGDGHEFSVRVFVDGVAQNLKQSRNLVQVRVLSGNYGRLLYLLNAETARIRRLGRALPPKRFLSTAHGPYLDAIGTELAVPRFTEDVSVENGKIITSESVEDDVSYRRRLALYRQVMMPTRNEVLGRLNGSEDPYADSGPQYRPGPLQEMGLGNVFDLEERDNAMALAIRLVSVAETVPKAAAKRHKLLAYLRDTVLINPAQDVPAHRKMPTPQKALEQELRERLRLVLNTGSGGEHFAPALAHAFDRVGRVMRHLGSSARIRVRQGQSLDGGSRYELGLCAEIDVLPATVLTSLANAVATSSNGGDDTEVLGLVHAMKDADRSDELGQWLLKACGFRTVHRLGNGRLLVSHFTLDGLVIDGACDISRQDARNGVPLRARFLAHGDDDIHAALGRALNGGEAGWTPPDPPWDRVAVDDRQAVWDTLSNLPTLSDRLKSVGLPGDVEVSWFATSIERLDPELVIPLKLESAFTTQLMGGAGEETAWERLETLLQTLRANGVASAALLGDGAGGLVLIVGAIGLPGIGGNLGGRHSTGFQWRLQGINNAKGALSPGGNEVTFTGVADGISAVIAFGRARVGQTDPFEIAVRMNAGETLDFKQYEFLMNILDHAHPVGVEVNTWDVRQQNVALDSNRGAEPLALNLSRSFRTFRRPRFAGVSATPVQND